LRDIVIFWDDDDDHDGNFWHICVEEHGLTREEVEEVLQDEESEIEVSRSTGRPTAFGWTSSGERIAVVFEALSEDPTIVYPISAFRNGGFQPPDRFLQPRIPPAASLRMRSGGFQPPTGFASHAFNRRLEAAATPCRRREP
jgi:uncharacterized DUF497 family protein